MPVRTYGVDWAVYQQTGSAPRVKAQGGSFLIAKVSQDHVADSAGDDLIRAAKSAGLVPGAYHFLIEPGAGKGPARRRNDGKIVNGYRGGKGADTPELQARNFVARAKAANGGTLDGLICAVDLEALNETSADGTSRVIQSRPRAYHAQAFAREFHRLAPGHPILLYTTSSYLRGVDLRKWSQPAGLWLAYWTASGTNDLGGRHGIPESRWTSRYGGVTPTIVQYQSGGHGGRAGGVWSDLDASDLTRAQLVEALTRPKVAEVPDPDPTPTPDPDPEPSPTPDTRYCLRLQGLALLDPETLAPLLVAPYGSALQVEAGPIGSDELDGGLRWAPSLLVLGLEGGPSFSRPLMAEPGCPAPLGSESPCLGSGPSGSTSTASGPT